MIDLMHKLALTSLIQFAQSSYVMILGMAIAISYLILILIVKPYTRKSDDRLHLFAQVEIFMFLLVAYSFQSQIDLDDYTDTLLSILLVVVTAIFLIFFVYQSSVAIVYLFNLWRKEMKNGDLAEEFDENDNYHDEDSLELPKLTKVISPSGPRTQENNGEFLSINPLASRKPDGDEENTREFLSINPLASKKPDGDETPSIEMTVIGLRPQTFAGGNFNVSSNPLAAVSPLPKKMNTILSTDSNLPTDLIYLTPQSRYVKLLLKPAMKPLVVEVTI